MRPAPISRSKVAARALDVAATYRPFTPGPVRAPRPRRRVPFQELLDLHGRAVWGLLAAMVGDDAADDCFQDTFLAALRAWPGADHDADPRPWLLTIARHKALDHLRRARREVLVAAPPERPEPVPGVDEVLARAGFVEALRALPPGQRSAIGRRFLADESYRTIGAALGCSEPAARRRVADGLAALRARGAGR